MPTPPRILLIEDDPDSRRNTALLLALEGFEVAVAEDGAEGLRQLDAAAPDLVVCDILMPGLDGHGVLAEARRNPRHARLPFVFLTALTDRESHRRGMDGGADDYLTKPLNPQELLAAVRARLRRAAEQAQGPDRAGTEQRLRALLSDRELEVLALLGRGLSSKEIASDLGLSPRTVESHRANIMRKVEVRNATALARLATEAGLA